MAGRAIESENTEPLLSRGLSPDGVSRLLQPGPVVLRGTFDYRGCEGHLTQDGAEGGEAPCGRRAHPACVGQGIGRSWSYLILGRTASPVRLDSESSQTGLPVHQIEKGKEDGIEEKEKALSIDDTAQTIDPIKSKAASLSLVPSPSKNKEKAPVPKKQKKPVVFSFPKIARLWFKIKRKLGHYCDDTMAMAFDRLPHHEKTVIIDGLQAEEQELVYLGKVAAPPLTRPKGFLTVAAEEDQRLAACDHEPADDLPVACRKCGGYIGGAG